MLCMFVSTMPAEKNMPFCCAGGKFAGPSAHGVADPPPTASLTFFFTSPRARGGPWDPRPTNFRDNRNAKIEPWATQDRFLSIFGSNFSNRLLLLIVLNVCEAMLDQIWFHC